jgi:hypothetical protein
MLATEASPRRSRLRRAAATLFAAATLGPAALLLVARALPYAWPDLPASWWPSLDRLLEISSVLMVSAFAALPLDLIVLGAVALCLLVRRSWCVRRVGGRLALAGWLHGVAWLVLALNNDLFDLNRFLALLLWGTLPLGPCAAWLGRRTGRGVTLVVGAWLAVAILAVAAAPTRADAFGAVLWCVWQALLFGPGPRRVRGRELRLAALAGVPAVQAVAASVDVAGILLMPLAAVYALALARRLARRRRALGWLAAAPLVIAAVALARGACEWLFAHGGIRLGEGLAYSFCELPERSSIYAAIPHCATGGPPCADAVVAEYDARSLREKGRHRVFGDDFYGRIEQAVCYDDQVELGMCCVVENGQPREEGAVRFRADQPSRIESRRDGDTLARRLVYDPDRDEIIYAGNRIVRWRGGRVDTDVGDAVQAASRRLLRPGDIFVVESASIDRRRGSVFIGEFMHGSLVHEVDLETGRVRASLPAHNGGVLAATVDEPLDRLYVSGLLGVDVYDLATRRRIARLRTGLLARVPAVDAVHDLIYVPVTAEGRIHVFDRRSLARLGSIPIGLETRNAFVSADGRWLFGSASHEHFAWDAARLARRFRGTERVRASARGARSPDGVTPPSSSSDR